MRTKFFAVLCAVLCGSVAAFVALDVLFPVSYYDAVKRYGDKFSVEPALVMSVICAESNFRAGAVSSAGACGLMQLLPSTAEWIAGELNVPFERERLFEPDYNIMLGTAYLGYLSTKFGGDFLLAAYNAGEGNARNWQNGDGVIEFPETKNYVKKVNFAKKIYSLRLGR